MLAKKKPATYADLLALPPHLVGEIVDGELYASPRPASPHARASSRLGCRRERMPELPDVGHFELAPDWLCEVLSLSTARLDRAGKMRHYAAAGVRHLWLVDPLATTLEVYRLDGTGWRLLETYAGDVIIRAEPFDAVELELGALWSR